MVTTVPATAAIPEATASMSKGRVIAHTIVAHMNSSMRLGISRRSSKYNNPEQQDRTCQAMSLGSIVRANAERRSRLPVGTRRSSQILVANVGAAE